jgi:multidrug efflux pump subunit AcrA (membrane-fusion protein)
MRSINLAAILFLSLSVISCKTKNSAADEGEIKSVTPVTVTTITVGAISDTVELNATSAFLLKTSVKAASNGYLQDVSVRLGQRVVKNQVLFLIRSKEANTIGNSINELDTAFSFSGLTKVKSPCDGYVTQLDYSSGDYVQDGESLATISDINSMVFLLSLPYELNPYLAKNRIISLLLPDGRRIPGTLSSSLPFVDPGSQTQNYIIRMDRYQPVPENLIARVNFIKDTKPDAVSLPLGAILTNEQQTKFWIMKMTDSSTAVKVPVVKGIETSEMVEIVSPRLNKSDLILLTGNYGLPDTARVTIENNK